MSLPSRNRVAAPLHRAAVRLVLAAAGMTALCGPANAASWTTERYLLTGGGLLLCAIISGGAFWMAAAHQRLATNAAAWPRVKALVIKSEAGKPDIGGQRNVRYVPHLLYRYDLGGTTYEGSWLRFGLSISGDQWLIERVLEPYPAGATIEVHVDPKDPKVSVIEPVADTADFTKAGWIMGITFALIAIWQAIEALR